MLNYDYTDFFIHVPAAYHIFHERKKYKHLKNYLFFFIYLMIISLYHSLKSYMLRINLLKAIIVLQVVSFCALFAFLIFE